MKSDIHSMGQLFLKTPDQMVYGPVDLTTLCGWACDARIGPGCLLAGDDKNWKPAENLAPLKMDWQVRMEDDSLYGPLNLLAIWNLMQEGTVARGARLINRRTQAAAEADDGLLPLAVQEARAILTALSAEMVKIADSAQTEVHRRAEDISKLVGENRLLRVRVEQLEKERSTQEATLETIRRRAADAEAQVAAFARQAAAHKKRAETLLAEEQERLRVQAAELHTAREELEREQTIHAASRAAHAEQLEMLMRKVADLERITRSVDEQIRQKDDQIKERDLRIQALTEDVAGRTESLAAALERREAELREQQQSAQTLREELERERQAHLETRAKQETAATILARRIADLEQERQAHLDAQAKQEAVATALTQRLAELEQEQQAHLETRAKQETAATVLARRIAALEQELRERPQLQPDRETVATLTRRIAELEQERRAYLETQAKQETASAALAARVGELEQERSALSHALRTAQAEADEKTTQIVSLIDERSFAKQQETTVESGPPGEEEAQAWRERYAQAVRDLDAAKSARTALESQWREQEGAYRRRIEALEHEAAESASAKARDLTAIQAGQQEFATQRDEAQRRVAELEGRVGGLERELETARNAVKSAALNLQAAVQEAQRFRAERQDVEAQLGETISRLQRDLAAAVAARKSPVARPGRRAAPVAAPIDWVDVGHQPVPRGDRHAETWGTDGGELASRLDHLKQELRTSDETRERVEKQLDDYKLLNQALQQESDGKEKELQTRIEQLKNEVEASSTVLQQTLLELEQRESNLRSLRKRAELRERDLAARIAELERQQGKRPAQPLQTEVVEGELQTGPLPEEQGASQPDGARQPANPKHVLVTMEAQAQAELAKWETLSAKQGKRTGKGKNWFWRKKS